MVFSWECMLSISRVHSNEVKPMHSTSRSHALFGVTLPCPGKCWACKTELSIIQHEQEDVWSDMGGGQGPTKPRADRGYHFDVSVWACRVAQGVLGNLLETPPPHIEPLSFFLPLPYYADASLHPLCPAPFSFWHALPHTQHLCSEHAEANPQSDAHILQAVHTHVHAHTSDMRASFLCSLTKQEQAALVTDNKVVNGWFWWNSIVAVSQEWHYSFIRWIVKVPLSRVLSRSHTIASLITLSSEKREVNGWHFATPWVLLPITIETQIRTN